jgi:hypothetical protein
MLFESVVGTHTHTHSHTLQGLDTCMELGDESGNDSDDGDKDGGWMDGTQRYGLLTSANFMPL